MNFLAHAALAGPDPDWQLGGLIADFSRPAQESGYHHGILAGIRLHRAIDGFTDRHPQVRVSRQRMSPPYRRAAGILVDVFYDHFLALAWSEHYPEATLEVFAQRIYALLRSRFADLPGPMKPAVENMIQYNWLVNYRDPDYIAQVIERIARRMSRPELLIGGGVELERCGPQLMEDFCVFFRR